MREKILHIFRFILATPLLLIGILFKIPFVSKAAEFTLAADSIALLEDGASMLSFSSCIPYGYLPLLFLNSSKEADTEAVFCSYLDNQDIYKFDNLQVTNRPLSYDEIDEINNTFYDGSGNVVDYSNVFFCNVDNGAFSYELYTTFDGSPIYLDTNKGTPALNVKLGGSMVSSNEWDIALSSLGNFLESNQYNIALSGSEPTSNAFYQYMGWASGQNRKLAYLYVSNINLPGVCVGVLQNGSCPNIIYTNDLSMVQWENVKNEGVGPNMINMYQGNWQYGQYNYSYRIELPFVINGDSPTSESVFDSYNGSERTFNLSATSYSYDDIIANPNAVSFTKVMTDEGVIVGNKYEYGDLDKYIDDVISTPRIINPDFVAGEAISGFNWPFDIDIPDYVRYPGVIPWPEVIERNPTIEWPIDEPITIPSGPFDIPMVGDLRSRFPFSIPWDLRNIIRGLNVARTAPRFQASWFIQPLNYTWVIDIDLSSFNAQAQIFRTCFLILFLIGLAKFSYEHFFGS